MFGKSNKKNNNLIAVSLYQRCVDQARNPEYYTFFSIQDKILGRFEVLSLQLFVMLRRLKEDRSKLARDLSQQLCDLFVADMDHSLRDAHLTESKIDKSFKLLVEGFYGRLVAYDAGLDGDGIHAPILKNVYDDQDVNNVDAQKLTQRIMELLEGLRLQSDITHLNFNRGT